MHQRNHRQGCRSVEATANLKHPRYPTTTKIRKTGERELKTHRVGLLYELRKVLKTPLQPLCSIDPYFVGLYEQECMALLGTLHPRVHSFQPGAASGQLPADAESAGILACDCLSAEFYDGRPEWHQGECVLNKTDMVLFYLDNPCHGHILSRGRKVVGGA
jgi:hypothetical protein